MPEIINAPTTATLRCQAREAEERLDWQLAADLYQRAIDVYPPGFDGAGSLRQRDIALLTERAATCRRWAYRCCRWCLYVAQASTFGGDFCPECGKDESGNFDFSFLAPVQSA